MPTITGVSHVDLTVTDIEASEQWYAELLGMQRVLDGRNDGEHFAFRYLVHPGSMLIVGLVAHDDPASKQFDEHAVGLDHLSLNVASSEELGAWQQRLAERDIAHSPIVEGDLWDVLVFRDPDNIQLELFYMKPEAMSLLAG
jgi:catechol 2,3-dioxygenase-like lactoylglutathione lyase family enzyme